MSTTELCLDTKRIGRLEILCRRKKIENENSKEYVVTKVKSSPKKTVYMILDVLKEEKIVRAKKDKSNSRSFKLYIDNNPLVAVPKELDGFE